VLRAFSAHGPAAGAVSVSGVCLDLAAAAGGWRARVGAVRRRPGAALPASEPRACSSHLRATRALMSVSATSCSPVSSRRSSALKSR